MQRWVVRRATMVMTETQALTVDYRTAGLGSAALQRHDHLPGRLRRWLAGKAVAAGARLVTSTVATGLLRDGAGRVVGVRTDRPGRRPAGPGRRSPATASTRSSPRRPGLLPPADAAHHTLGVKEVLALPAETIDERFGLAARRGRSTSRSSAAPAASRAAASSTPTATSSASAWCCRLPGLAASGRPARGAHRRPQGPSRRSPRCSTGPTLKEYAAHLIPEGGYDAMPALAGDGLLVAGDAAGLTLAAGIWLEGVNFAIGSGWPPGRRRPRPSASGDVERGGPGRRTGGRSRPTSCCRTTGACGAPRT